MEWDVVTCVNRRNYPRLEQLKDALCETGVRRWRLFTIFPVGRAARYPEFQLDDGDFKGLMDFIQSIRREGRIRASYGCEGFLGSYEGCVRDGFYTCNAGITVAGKQTEASARMTALCATQTAAPPGAFRSRPINGAARRSMSA